FLLFEAVQHDGGIRNPLDPRQPALDFRRIGCASGCERDALGPARGVLVLLIGEPREDLPALRILLALGEVTVRGRGFDFPPPHLLNGCEVVRVDRHGYSSRTVPMPAVTSSTWRAGLSSNVPRCRSGIRSAIAT